VPGGRPNFSRPRGRRRAAPDGADSRCAAAPPPSRRREPPPRRLTAPLPSSRRLDELSRRAADLRARQEELQRLVDEVGAGFDALPEGERAEVLRALGAEGAAEPEGAPPAGTSPPPWAPGGPGTKGALDGLQLEAEALARRVEAGEGLPPMPGAAPAEDAARFLARIRASVAAFEELAARGAPPPAGADDGGWAGPFSRVAAGAPEEERARLVPAPPAPAQAAFERAERVAYILRRAHQGDAPGAPLEALRAAGLLAPGFVFEDPWVALPGAEAAAAYLGALTAAGATAAATSVFAASDEFEPLPRFRVVADVVMRLPLPRWYDAYARLHARELAAAAAAAAPPPGARRPGRDAGAEPGELYPRCEATVSAEERAGTAHARWLRGAAPLLYAPQAVVARPAAAGAPATVTARLIQPARALPPAGAALPDYSALPSPLDGDEWPDAGAPAVEAEADAEAAAGPPAPPSLPRAAPACLAREPLAPAEAEQLLRLLLGGRFDSFAGQLPKPGRGQAARRRAAAPGAGAGVDGALTIVASLFYEVDPATGAVASLDCHWDAVAGRFADARDAYDVYAWAVGLAPGVGEGEGEGDD
jgi:hypothetical protein